MPSDHTHICARCLTSTRWAPPRNAWMLWMGWAMIALGILALPIAPLWVSGVVLVVMGYRQRRLRCDRCGSKDMLPVDTMAGAVLVEEREKKRQSLAASAL